VENQQDSAQLLALRALAWLAQDTEQFQDFLTATGAGLDDIRARAGDPDFQLAILDFLLMDDQRIMAFCDAHALPYTAPQTARAALPGGEDTHWT
jgi:2-hydroxychromene-2-carboxylate isomerase